MSESARHTRRSRAANKFLPADVLAPPAALQRTSPQHPTSSSSSSAQQHRQYNTSISHPFPQHSNIGTSKMPTAINTNINNEVDEDRSDAIPHDPTAAAFPLSAPVTEKDVEVLIEKMKAPILGIDFTRSGKTRRAAALPQTQQLLRIGTTSSIHDLDDSSATNLITGTCCGGGCCRLETAPVTPVRSPAPGLDVPDNDAFRSLKLKLSPLSSRSRLSSITPLPSQNVRIEKIAEGVQHTSTVYEHPPKFVTPHPPFEVFAAKIDGTRELTKPGAPKRTYHFDLDVTDYPEESGVDFRVGGAIGVQAPNDFDTVDRLFDLLEIKEEERDVPVRLITEGGRWPTIWGADEPRDLITTRRELLTWTVDVQSYPPTKNLLRVLAEYASDETEKTILLYLCAKQGQAAFCEYVPFI